MIDFVFVGGKGQTGYRIWQKSQGDVGKKIGHVILDVEESRQKVQCNSYKIIRSCGVVLISGVLSNFA